MLQPYRQTACTLLPSKKKKNETTASQNTDFLSRSSPMFRGCGLTFREVIWRDPGVIYSQEGM